jgi:hypothetical protein
MTVPLLHRALYAYLSTYPPLVARIGTQCYAGLAPSDATFPYVVLHESGVGTHYTMQGPSATFETDIQIDCYALTALEAKQMARLVRLSLDGYPGVWDGLEIDAVFCDSEFDNPVFALDGSERAFHRRTILCTCWHERDVPTLSLE